MLARDVDQRHQNVGLRANLHTKKKLGRHMHREAGGFLVDVDDGATLTAFLQSIDQARDRLLQDRDARSQ